MSFKKAALCAFAAVALLTGAGCEQKPASPPPSPDEVRAKYTADIQQTLTAYFNTHGLKASDIKPGFTVPWVASKAGAEDHGFLVATGETSAKGCPVWKVSSFEHYGKYSSRADVKQAICP
ncbi:MAG: hypothetical protein ACAH80_05590 [Alphaproteobacteria bacterium]